MCHVCAVALVPALLSETALLAQAEVRLVLLCAVEQGLCVQSVMTVGKIGDQSCLQREA